MKLKNLYFVSAACALVVLSPLAATAQSPTATVRDTITTVDTDNDHDYGWIGLLGLLGLAGLMKKKPDDRRYDTTSARTDVNR